MFCVAVGIVSYSMQAGDTRGNNMDYTDATYDGMKSGGELRGGLGQLVDGEFGETSRPTTWVGWRNDTRSGIAPRAPPTITFEFDRVREFIAVHVHCNNKFTRDVRAFSLAMVRFSIGGVHYQEEAVYLELPPDNIFESARNVTISLHHRIARWVQLELHFAARWILISEVGLLIMFYIENHKDFFKLFLAILVFLELHITVHHKIFDCSINGLNPAVRVKNLKRGFAAEVFVCHRAKR